MRKAEVIDLVRVHLHRRRPPGINGVDVVEDGVEARGAWWYVPVRAEREPQKRYRYYEWLSEIADNIKRERDVNMLLLPSP